MIWTLFKFAIFHRIHCGNHQTISMWSGRLHVTTFANYSDRSFKCQLKLWTVQSGNVSECLSLSRQRLGKENEQIRMLSQTLTVQLGKPTCIRMFEVFLDGIFSLYGSFLVHVRKCPVRRLQSQQTKILLSLSDSKSKVISNQGYQVF